MFFHEKSPSFTDLDAQGPGEAVPKVALRTRARCAADGSSLGPKKHGAVDIYTDVYDVHMSIYIYI